MTGPQIFVAIIAISALGFILFLARSGGGDGFLWGEGACRSVRGWLFGAHRFRRQTKDWHGFDRVVGYNGHDGVICTRCGNFDFTVLRGKELEALRVHFPIEAAREEEE